MATLAESLRSIIDQLAWRGPTGKAMGHIVLTREQAEELAAAALSFRLCWDKAANNPRNIADDDVSLC